MESLFEYGLMVVDPKRTTDDVMCIVHFAGYWEEPTEKDIEHLREELRTDPQFELCDVIDELEIKIAPDYVIEQVWHEIIRDNIGK